MNSEHKVGEVLTLRSWQSAENEYGLIGTSGALATPGISIGCQRTIMCGSQHAISEVYTHPVTRRAYYYLEGMRDFPFPQEMFVEVNNELLDNSKGYTRCNFNG